MKNSNSASGKWIQISLILSTLIIASNGSANPKDPTVPADLDSSIQLSLQTDNCASALTSTSASEVFQQPPVLSRDLTFNLTPELSRIEQKLKSNTVTLDKYEFDVLLRNLKASMRYMDPAALIMTLRLLKRVPYSIPNEFFSKWETAASAKLEQFSETQLVGGFRALAGIEANLSPEFVKSYTQHLSIVLNTYSASELASILEVFDSINAVPSKPFYDLWQKAAVQTMGEATALDLSRQMAAAGRIRIRPRDWYLKKWFTAKIATLKNPDKEASVSAFSLQAELSAQVNLRIMGPLEYRLLWQKHITRAAQKSSFPQVANSLMSFSRLPSEATSEYKEAWFNAALILAPSSDSRSIANTIYALYLMRDGVSAKALAQKYSAESIAAIRGSEIHRSQVELALLYFKKVQKIEIPELKEYAVDRLSLPKPTDVSSIELQLRRNLEARNIKYISEYQTGPGLYVEIYIPSENKLQQADGPHHFFTDVYALTYEARDIRRPEDDRMDELLKTYGYNIERLKYTAISVDLGIPSRNH